MHIIKRYTQIYKHQRRTNYISSRWECYAEVL